MDFKMPGPNLLKFSGNLQMNKFFFFFLATNWFFPCE